jgi:hypothetical protein
MKPGAAKKKRRAFARRHRNHDQFSDESSVY